MFFQFVARFPSRFRALGAEIPVGIDSFVAVDGDCPKASVATCDSSSDDIDIFVYLRVRFTSDTVFQFQFLINRQRRRYTIVLPGPSPDVIPQEVIV